jgi:DNA-binding transcriptional LysR family regulator
MSAIEPFETTLLSIELRHLRALAAVFECGSISAAAKKLHVQQPTLSRTMRAVERGVGVQLFDRTAKGIVPTAYGTALLQYQRALDSNLRHAASELDTIRGVPPAIIRIGVGPIEGSTIASAAVTRFLDRTPDAQISIREGLYATLQPALAAGELDLIIGSEPSAVEEIDSHPGMKFELLGHLRPAIVVRASHPLAKKRRVTLHDLQQARWIVPHGNTASHERFRAAFVQNGLLPPSGTVFAPLSSWTAVGIVRRTDIVALLPQQLIQHEIESGALKALHFERALFEAPAYLITREATILSTTCKQLLRDVRDVCQSLRGEFL